MTIRQCDNPTLISLDMLRQLDTDPPGTWLAQSKYDGWRRTMWSTLSSSSSAEAGTSAN